jgi:hypothetical protein
MMVCGEQMEAIVSHHHRASLWVGDVFLRTT